MAHGDAREMKWRGHWRMEWVASTLHTTSEHGVSSITTSDAHTSAVSSRLNWRPRRFKWTRPFRRKTKSGFCACAITFQTQSTIYHLLGIISIQLNWTVSISFCYYMNIHKNTRSILESKIIYLKRIVYPVNYNLWSWVTYQ